MGLLLVAPPRCSEKRLRTISLKTTQTHLHEFPLTLVLLDRDYHLLRVLNVLLGLLGIGIGIWVGRRRWIRIGMVCGVVVMGIVRDLYVGSTTRKTVTT